MQIKVFYCLNWLAPFFDCQNLKCYGHRMASPTQVAPIGSVLNEPPAAAAAAAHFFTHTHLDARQSKNGRWLSRMSLKITGERKDEYDLDTEYLLLGDDMKEHQWVSSCYFYALDKIDEFKRKAYKKVNESNTFKHLKHLHTSTHLFCLQISAERFRCSNLHQRQKPL